MKFTIISVGKIKEAYLKEGIKEYLTHLRPYVAVEMLEGFEERTPPNPSSAQIETVKAREGSRILAAVKEGDFLVALDPRGQSPDSEGMAAIIQNWMNQGQSNIVFAIGGSHGLSPEVLARSNLKLSLSNLTLLHQMTALILVEQLYRGFKIIRGEPYHK